MRDVSGSDSSENDGSEREGAESNCGEVGSRADDDVGEKRNRACGVGGRTAGGGDEGEGEESLLDVAFALGRERSRARGRLEGVGRGLVGCAVSRDFEGTLVIS